MIEFRKWDKIHRVKNECYVVTEKLDGTNACIVIDEEGNIGAQSRKRLITPDDDNFGFAAWVQANKETLLKLGRGHHFGEWWGEGIQRRYGLDNKRFSLFNTSRDVEPEGCSIVPILAVHGILEEAVKMGREALKDGSVAAPGFDRPEGTVIFCTKNRCFYKDIIDKD